jgi:hypothetical protein
MLTCPVSIPLLMPPPDAHRAHTLVPVITGPVALIILLISTLIHVMDGPLCMAVLLLLACRIPLVASPGCIPLFMPPPDINRPDTLPPCKAGPVAFNTLLVIAVHVPVMRPTCMAPALLLTLRQVLIASFGSIIFSMATPEGDWAYALVTKVAAEKRPPPARGVVVAAR